MANWTLVVASNDARVLENTLLASPAIDDCCQVVVERDFPCAGSAYNRGLEEANCDLVVFAHQDVYLPSEWMNAVRVAVDAIDATGTNWGTLGVFGATRQSPAQLRGYCYSTGLDVILGAPFDSPIPARTLDELVLIVRRSSGLRFDEKLPGFHLYGADICLQAESRALTNYIIPAFCIHNANGVVRLPEDFWRAYFYLRGKWLHNLPVTTCCTTITRTALPVAHRIAVECKERLRPRKVGKRSTDVTRLYDHLRQDHPEITKPIQRGPLPTTAVEL